VIGFAFFCPMSFISIIFFERFRKKGYHNIHILEYTIHSRNADKELNVHMFHSYISLTLHLHTVFMLKCWAGMLQPIRLKSERKSTFTHCSHDVSIVLYTRTVCKTVVQ
jgi:hypothetical protein